MKKILIVDGIGFVATELTQMLLKNFHLKIYDLFHFDRIIKNRKE